MGENTDVGVSARNLALRVVAVFLAGTLVGSLAPESGNILAYYLKMPYVEGHYFNPYFLALGIVGVVLACAIGYREGKRKSKVLVVGDAQNKAKKERESG